MMEKHNSQAKEAGRACHKDLISRMMELGQNSDDLVFVLGKCSQISEDLGQTTHGKGYQVILLELIFPSRRIGDSPGTRNGTSG